MKNMTLSAIAHACNGQLFTDKNDHGKEISGVTLDSRKIEKNFLFIATVGERVDGHLFINDVYEQGALAVICEKAPTLPKGSYILVKNSFEALKSIATWYRKQLDIKVIGITGSVGKTSTKEFISSVLSKKYAVLKTEGNFNNEIGLPLTILNIRDHHEVAVLEMGISEFGEMHRLSEIAKPDICVITNIGQCHLENLGSRQGVLKAKTEIFDFMNENGSVCLNGDDDLLKTISQVNGRSPITYGLKPQNDVYAANIESHGLSGSTCSINMKHHSFPANVPLPGNHMILNALAAALIGSILNMTQEEIASGIASVQPVNGRSNIIRLDDKTIIDDCYNANPESMKAAINLLSVADTNKVAILGDMFELGNNEHDLHKEVGTYAATREIDTIICVGTLSSYIYDGAAESFQGKLLYFATREELLTALPSVINKNDTILVKASHGMGLELIVKALLS